MPRSPSLQSAPHISRYPLAAGLPGIGQTVSAMYALIDAGSRDPDIRRFTLELLNEAGVRDRDDIGAVQAVYQWVQSNLRFTHDPHGKELIGDARYLLDIKAGDCDDYVVVLGAMLQAIGIPIRICTVRADKTEPGRFSHTYPVATLRSGAQVALDATQREAWPGWEPPVHFGKKLWPVPTTFQTFPGVAPNHESRTHHAGQQRGRQGLGLGDTVDPSQGTVDVATLANSFGTDAANIIAALRNPAPQYLGPANPNAIGASLTAGGGSLQANVGLPSWMPWVIVTVGVLTLVIWISSKK